jgi:polyisoprenoid-binding protein YceI
MNKIFRTSVIGLFSLISLTVMSGHSREIPEHKVNINLSDSRIQWTGSQQDAERSGFSKLTGGELVMDNTDIKGGSFTVNLNSVSNKDSKARFEIKKVTKLPVTRTEEGDIKFTHKIEGELTMMGHTKTISFDASVNILNGKVAASSQAFRIDNNTSMQIELVTE